VQEACLKIIQAGLAESAHDCSDGGLAVTIAESCFSTYRRDALGCEIDLTGGHSAAALLFAETPSRIVISAMANNLDQILELAGENNVAAAVIGRTGGDRLAIDVNGERAVDRSIAEVESAWRGVLPGMLETASIVAAEEK
jgi:phosphoribosylformylglycinamidine synthase